MFKREFTFNNNKNSDSVLTNGTKGLGNIQLQYGTNLKLQKVFDQIKCYTNYGKVKH